MKASFGSKLSLSTLIDLCAEKERERRDQMRSYHQEFASEIAKTVKLTNVPFHITAEQVVKAASVPGGIRMIKL